MPIRIIDGLNRHLFDAVVEAHFGDLPVVLLDTQGNPLIGELPDVPTITSAIADRVYAVGGNTVTIDAATRFNGATSYSMTPTNLPGVSWDGRVMTIEPTTVIRTTTITLRGINAGGTSEPLSFTLTVNAADPTVADPLPDQELVTGSANVVIALGEHFEGAATYAVSPTGQGVTISGANMTISAAAERNGTYTVTATNSTGQSVSDEFSLVVAAEVVVPVEPEPEPDLSAQRVIVLTDYAGDCDDAAAFAIVARAQRLNDINLLGIVVTSNIATSAPGVRGQMMAYGMGDVPIYAYQGPLGDYNNRLSAEVRDAHGVPGETRTAYQDDITGLRTLLAAAPDNSVVLIDIGAPVSTARLLDSPADAISPLTGMELAARKVRWLEGMAGQFPTSPAGTPEYNMRQHAPSSQRVYRDWPTPIIAHGFELGNTIYTGPAPGTANGVDPVRTAFTAFRNIHGGPLQANGTRQSWDPVAVHRAIYGNQSLYRLAGENGTITVAADGGSVWSATPAGTRSYVAKAAGVTDANVATALQVLINDQAIIADAPPAGEPQPSAIVHRHFDLNEGAGSPVSRDGSITLLRSASAVWREDPVGIAFSGAGSHLRMPATPEMNRGNLLMGFLFRLDKITGTQVLATLRVNEITRNQYQFRANGASIEYVAFNPTAYFATSAPVLEIGPWYMGVAFVTDTTATVRLNGQVVAASEFPDRYQTDPQASPIVIGARLNGTTYSDFLDGDMIGYDFATSAVAADIPAFEAELRRMASARGITIP